MTDMSVQLIIAICGICSLLASVGGTVVGAWIGSRIAMAKLEVWKDIRDGDIRSAAEDVGRLKEDVGIHEVEIGTLMAIEGLPRASRQLLRR